MKDIKALCADIESAAREAGRFIMQESATFDIHDTETKGRNNFVTYVDKGSEKMLVERLAKLIPEAGFIAEEGTSVKKGEKYNWIIDPLDGTTNFLHNVHPFAVSIGLMEDDEVIAGVVHEAGGQETFTAWKGGGAWLNGKRIHVSKVPVLSGALAATGFPYNLFDRLDPYMDLLKYLVKNTHGVRRLGSAAIDLAYVACGRYDFFYEYDLKIWDVAAGMLIVREAGGKFSDFSGNMTGLDGNESLASNSLIYNEVLEVVQSFMKQNK
ncbi:MAG TPA: inositol monophosphatase family protein [Bacteroidales bacterium]|jgi:myo-inositol-1(or 4)-monophosphatase|nr:inositol monophosphatase [Bacteroidales bacterium]MDI9552773.1 inositol monophosphatase family protein [Bacteroidota bacterium]MZP66108.1 inositol monophosphatase [Bacteroidales bacterium]NLK55163.1 inositol monophosphatase [Bacteroidales bacterium]HNY52702.1 inositol monophosphatase family protein [Bacteroidales bacterium]